MGKITFYLGIAFALLLSGCSNCCTAPSPTPTPTSVNPSADDAEVQLAEAAASISESLTDLNAMEKAAMAPINCKPLPCLTCEDMCKLVSIDWSGPIEPLLRRIALMQCYKLKVIGARPAVPVLVTILAKDTPIGYIIRDANFQAASKACVTVYPNVRIIELRYGRV